MTPRPALWICSGDAILVQRLRAFAAESTEVRVAADWRDWELQTEGITDQVALMDLRVPDFQRGLELAAARRETAILLAIATPDSAPARRARQAPFYAVLEPECPRPEFQLVLTRAIEHAQLRQECAMWRTGALAPPPPAAERIVPGADSRSLRSFALALRDFDRLDTLCQQIVDGVAAAARISRVGLFYRTHEDLPFTLRAGVRCLERTLPLAFADHHPLALWLHTHAHLIARGGLEHIGTPADRQLLRQSLDLLGAEVLIPIHARHRFAGWLMLGHHLTGRPFSQGDLEELMSLAEHIAVVLENARLYEEISLRKSMAETLFDNLPTGIVATDGAGLVLWINRSAADILAVNPADHLGKPVDNLGSRMADCVRRTLTGQEWRHADPWPLTGGRLAAVQSRHLRDGQDGIGAVVLLQDITDQHLMQERQEQMARCAFWGELAASMSHEVRNPLVAIKTFAQLLPERHADTEFRTQFSEVVSQEVDRLDGIVKQMNHFANLPRPTLAPMDLRDALRRGEDEAKLRVPAMDCPIHLTIPSRIPPILGDLRVLSDCFAHLFANAMEAMVGRAQPQIHVQVTTIAPSGDLPLRVHVAIADRGPGLPADLADKVFSPFYTTKNRAMGLGLPIVQRMLLDHNGQIRIDSDTKGATVHVSLPAAEAIEENAL